MFGIGEAVAGAFSTLYREEQKGGITGFMAGMVPGTGIYKAATGKTTGVEAAFDVAVDVLSITPLGWVARGGKVGSVAAKLGSKLLPKGLTFAAGKGTGAIVKTGTKTGVRMLPKAAKAVPSKALLYGGLGMAGIGAGAAYATTAQGQPESTTYEPEQPSRIDQLTQDSTVLWAVGGLAVLIIGYAVLRKG